MALKYTETGNGVEAIRRFQRQFSNQDTVQTHNNGQLQQLCPVWFMFQQERRQ